MRIFKLCAIMLVVLNVANAADIYVSPKGSDSNKGTKKKPFATLLAAKNAAHKYAGKETVTVYVEDGVYYLPEALVFNSEDSGTEKYPIVFKAINEGGAVLSGGTKLQLDWKPFRDGIYHAIAPDKLNIDQLFINGLNQRMARYPNYDATKKTDAYQGYAADAFSKERAAKWKNPEGGYIHAMHSKRWGGYHYMITGKNTDGEVTYEGGWQNNRQMGMHKEYRMVENIFEELDAPGEWFHDAENNTLYYMPESKTDLAKATVEVVRLKQLVEFHGSKETPVKHITFQGFVVRHAARTFMETKEPMVRSDWTIFRGGAFMLTGTENIQILDCEFDQVGGNAIFVSNYNRHTLVKGTHIHHTGASGICFVGDPNALRDPLFEYGEKNDISKLDHTPGPKTENYPALSAVEDCLIHNIGTVERQPAGVQITMASEISVRDCSIYDCARSGINIGDGAFGGHLIERCDVFNTVLETHDHGSFNSWGRDRYWRVEGLDLAEYPELPFADAMKTTVIRNSRWRCDHGWDIDLDDGSTNYDIYNNLMLAGGLKLREGFRRRAWNNITVNNTFHPHVWYPNSNDEVFSNIFMFVYQGVKVPTVHNSGKLVDSNLLFNAQLSQVFGWDENSIVADPQFIDPVNGDFRVKDGSPAFDIGFENFPMDQFGVKKPSLKAIAKAPVIPALGISEDLIRKDRTKKRKPKVISWMGATISGLTGMEFSAYGVSKEDGGIALKTVPEESQAAKAGFKEGDLILMVNEHKVDTEARFLKVVEESQFLPLKLNVVREQQEIFLTLANAQNRRSNPIVSHMFTADATARVWEDGRLYIYPSTDVAPSKGYRTMDGYHVFSTDDMITFKDHGEILHSRDVSWGTEKGGYMWAPDCVHKDGIYYYYFPHKNADMVWELGVATSEDPASNFELQGYVKGGNTFCDPNIFIDDDGQAYLYAVVDTKCHGAKLKDNMMEIEGGLVHQVGTDEHREGPFVFKRQGKYYMIYPDHHKPRNEMQYSMSDNPLGPWEAKGLFMEQNDVITMHGSVVEYKGQWYIFYHNGNLSGGIATNRSICFDPVYFNEDGTIQMVKKTLGVDLPTFHKDVNFNEMFGTLPIGNYQEVELKKQGIQPDAISSIQIPEGYVVECFEEDQFEGKSWIFSEDRIDLNAIGCNNVISSIKVSKSVSENLANNPSFELSTQGLVKYWFNRAPKPYARILDDTGSGYYSLQYKGQAAETPKALIQKVEVTANTEYELSIMLKVEAGTKGKIIFDAKGAFEEPCQFELDADTRADEWVEFNGTFNSGKSTEVELRCRISPNFNGACNWDNVMIKEKN